MNQSIVAQCTPDDPCSAHDPCPAHAELAAQYLALVLPAGTPATTDNTPPASPEPPSAGGQEPRAIVPLYGGRYRAYWDDHIVGEYGCYHDAELGLDDYAAGLFADGLIDQPPVVHARPAEPAADLLYACSCQTDPLAAALADDPNLATTASPAQAATPAAPVLTKSATVRGEWACEVGHAFVSANGIVPPLCPVCVSFTRASEYDLAPLDDSMIADAYRCVAQHVFWVTPGARPIACPRCEHLNAPLAAPSLRACPACGGSHVLAHCEELAREWTRQAQEEIRAGARIGKHIERDIDGFLREYKALTDEQRANVVHAYCAWQRAGSQPGVVAKRWARMAGLV